MFWFYPREYTDQESYDERFRNYNKNTFRTTAPVPWPILTRLGYVVVEPESPIVGDQGAMNNNYVHDLRNNLSAVIDTIREPEVGWTGAGSESAATAMAPSPPPTPWFTRPSSRRESPATETTTGP